MAVNYSGSTYFGTPSNSSNYWTYTQPTFTSALGGVWSLFWIFRLQHAVGGSSPMASSSDTHSIWSNVVGETLGAGGNDCYLGWYSCNSGTITQRLTPQFRMSVAGVNLQNSGSWLAGTAQLSRNVVYCAAVVCDGTNVSFYICPQGGSAVLQQSAAINASFKNANQSLGTMRAGFGKFADEIQAFGQCNGLALTTANIASLAAGTDPSTVIPSNQTHLLQWNTNGNITATWGSQNATLVGSINALSCGSPMLPTAGSTFLNCNEPPPYAMWAFNFGANSATQTLTGTYNGFTPSTFQYQVTDTTGTVITAWTNLASFTASAGNWSGNATLPAGYGRIFSIRDSSDHSKIWNGTHPILCGIAECTIGQSQSQRMEALYQSISTLNPSPNNVGFVTVNQFSGVANTWALATIGPENFRVNTAAVGAGWLEEINQWAATTNTPLLLMRGAVAGTASSQWVASFNFPWTSTTTTFTTGGSNDTLTLPATGNPCGTDSSYNNVITYIYIGGTRYTVSSYVASTRIATIVGHAGLSGTVTFTASGACAVDSSNFLECWAYAQSSIVASGVKFVNITWLQGTADNGLTDATIKSHLDSIYAGITSSLGGLGIGFNFIVDPQCRDTGTTAMAVNASQTSWCVNHPDFGVHVFLGVPIHDMSTNCEYIANSSTYNANSITVPADAFTDQQTWTTCQITTGGLAQTVTGTTTGNVFTITSGNFSPALSGTVTARLSSFSPHQDYYGSVIWGKRRGAQRLYQYGLSALNPQGPTLVSATYPHGGDGSVIDWHFLPAPGGSNQLRTPNGGISPSVIKTLEASENSFSSILGQTSQVLVGPMTIRTFGTAPAVKANLKVRVWSVNGNPITYQNFTDIQDGVYDNNGIGAPGGSPAWPNYNGIQVTEAPPVPKNRPRFGGVRNAPRLGVNA